MKKNYLYTVLRSDWKRLKVIKDGAENNSQQTSRGRADDRWRAVEHYVDRWRRVGSAEEHWYEWRQVVLVESCEKLWGVVKRSGKEEWTVVFYGRKGKRSEVMKCWGDEVVRCVLRSYLHGARVIEDSLKGVGAWSNTRSEGEGCHRRVIQFTSCTLFFF